jgi:hypothetical protein
LVRKYRIAAQFTIWDKIRLTADMKETQLNNLAKFISHLIRWAEPAVFNGRAAAGRTLPL